MIPEDLKEQIDNELEKNSEIVQTIFPVIQQRELKFLRRRVKAIRDQKRKQEHELMMTKVRGHKSMRVQKILNKQNSFFKSPLTGNGSGFGSFKLSKGNTLMG